MRVLLFLISFSCLADPNIDEYQKYEVQPGDNLTKIAKKYEIPIQLLVSANKELALEPDFLRIGQIIFLPVQTKIEYEEYCFGPHNITEFISFNTQIHSFDYADKCLKKIQNDHPNSIKIYNLDIDDDFWKIYFSSRAYSYYLINLWIRGDISQQKRLSLKKITIEAARRGDLIAMNTVLPYLSLEERQILIDSSSVSIAMKEYLIANWVNGLTRTDFLSINSKELDKFSRIKFNQRAASYFFKERDVKYLTFLQDLLNDISEITNSFISLNHFSAVISASYYFLNDGQPKKSYITLSNFARDICALEDKFSTILTEEEIKNYPRGLTKEEENQLEILRCTPLDLEDFFYERLMTVEGIDPRNFYYQINALDMYRLNSMSAWVNLTPSEWESKVWEQTFTGSAINWFSERKYLSGDKELQESVRSDSRTLETSAIAHASLAENLKMLGDCKLALKYYEKTFKQYENISFNNLRIFDESLSAAACAIKEGNNKLATKHLNNAEITRSSLKSGRISSFENILLDLLKIVAKKAEMNESEFSSSILLLSEKLQKLESNTDFAGTEKSLDLFSYFYLESYFNSSDSIRDKMLDPIQLKNLFNRNLVAKNIADVYLNSKDIEKKKLLLEIKSLNSKINSYERNIAELSFEELVNLEELYASKRKTFNNLLSLNSINNNIVDVKDESISSLQMRLKEDEVVLTYFFSDLGSRYVAVKKNSIISNEIPFPKQKILESISKLRFSISYGEKNFDFEESYKLHNLIFSEVAKNLNDIETIYIYDPKKIHIPFSALISSLNKSKNFYQTVVNSSWLIDSFAFAYISPTKQKPSIQKFNSPFLGFANPSSYRWIGLPELVSAEEEINNLAIASRSYKEDILIGSKATKEIFLEKAKEGFERIVLATHAVPQGWEGLIDEPAIVMGSSKGDYFLTASEISALEIPTDMVILSACNDPKQELSLLYKSFLIAGAKSVLHSGWNLESKFAKEFTTNYFEMLWTENLSEKHINLANVSRKFKNNFSEEIYSDPVFWANFRVTYSTL